jgi:hypothetical protein
VLDFGAIADSAKNGKRTTVQLKDCAMVASVGFGSTHDKQAVV